MSSLNPGNVYIEISHNQAGGFSLCISDDDSGFRISGAKVGGCEVLKRFEINAKELIAEIKNYTNKKKVAQHDQQTDK
ncbi:hypothetical protein [Dickeya solani]|uniref:DUF1488 domain-containing protein n=1 Tax=Dickeya solani TaxID=1089444 RepID=A0ABU4EKP4_9GAMM|nr:hypothetical protein [Dickeya solani]MCA6998187.1 hypothetical protein [Dickeya solani]MCA6999518.1 hypothetical protein [Dickeya solani]MCZ0823868.1 hypothetical protein [Dickeya solani]MDV6997224.1 hypothetical protein [Dickeya solani]MDV7006506.1 hypothetical protein [Dickeya solani]